MALLNTSTCSKTQNWYTKKKILGREKWCLWYKKYTTCGNLLALPATQENWWWTMGSPAQHLSWHNIKRWSWHRMDPQKKEKEKEEGAGEKGERVRERWEGGPARGNSFANQALALRSILSCQCVPGVNKVISFNPALQLYITPSFREYQAFLIGAEGETAIWLPDGCTHNTHNTHSHLKTSTVYTLVYGKWYIYLHTEAHFSSTWSKTFKSFCSSMVMSSHTRSNILALMLIIWINVLVFNTPEDWH